MHYVYIDFETWMSRHVKLSKMTLRQYLAATRLLSVAWACDDGPVQYLAADADGTLPVEFVGHLTAAALDPDVTFVAHNAAFDIRVARLMLGIPQPQHVHCTLELAHAAFPNQPGGYKLKKLAETLSLSAPKLDLDLSKKYTPAQLAAYCSRDTQLCREIHQLALPRLPAREIELSELCNAAREMHFVIRPEKVAAAIEQFSTVAAQAVVDAMAYLDRDGTQVADAKLAFGWIREPGTLGDDDPGLPKSVKPEKLKALLLDRLGFDTRTISYKKINPTHLAANEKASAALIETSRANKALSHKRRTAVFGGVAVVDAESGFFRAHTGRESSPSTGRGLNLHNMPKHDKAVARPVREMFEMPEGLCMVQADLANVEYRIEGWMTRCAYTERLFTERLLADPYSEFGYASTGVRVTKEDPSRQVYKASVLGLGFMMGIGTWMSQLLLLISNPANEVTLEDLEALCVAQDWAPVTDRWALAQQTKIHAPNAVLTTAFYMRQKFHEIHPEFALFGKWLMHLVERVSSAIDPESMIEQCYNMPNAPDRSRLDLSVDPGLSGRTIRASCGPWSQTVAWRDIGLHDTKLGFCLSSVQAGNKAYRKLTPNILIENAVQSCARNALCKGKLELRRRGWNYQLSVHDAPQIICSRDCATVLAARRDLLDVYGPGNALGFDWAAVINPEEIGVSQSLFERDMGELLPAIGTRIVKGKEKPVYPPASEWWRRLGAGEDSLLDVLP